MARIALIYPGQGAQHAGMGREFFDAYESVRARFAECSELLSEDMEALCFTENDRLDETQYTQPAMVLMELALTEVVKRELGMADRYGQAAAGAEQARQENAAADGSCSVSCSAGLSLGEYAAIAEAGAMSFADAIRTVALRGKLMAEAVPSGEGAMAAVLGLSAEQIEAVIAPIDGAYIANYNCPGQIVITGARAAVEQASAALSEAGARKCVPLKVSGPFHSPLLSEAGRKLGAALESVQFSAPEHPYLANVTAEAVSDEAEIRELLTKQVSSSVRWQQSVEAMLSDGVDTFIEIGPGKTLAGFMRKILKDYAAKSGADVSAVRTFSVETPEDLEKLKAALSQ